jgi:hypothetical protein
MKLAKMPQGKVRRVITTPSFRGARQREPGIQALLP